MNYVLRQLKLDLMATMCADIFSMTFPQILYNSNGLYWITPLLFAKNTSLPYALNYQHTIYTYVCKFYSTFCYSKNILARWRSIFLSWAENSDMLNFVEKKSMYILNIQGL